MENLYLFLLNHAEQAPWALLLLFMLAGFSLPISIDILVIIASLIAATILPEKLWHLYAICFIGTCFAAWIAYWIGRKLGHRLLLISWIKKFLPPHRLEKIQIFYGKHAFLTLLIGRFIPFGVRNALFMSAGISKFPFLKFIARDTVCAFLWTAIAFSLFHFLGSNYERLVSLATQINLGLFCSFGVTLIVFICYKRRKKSTCLVEDMDKKDKKHL